MTDTLPSDTASPARHGWLGRVGRLRPVRKTDRPRRSRKLRWGVRIVLALVLIVVLLVLAAAGQVWWVGREDSHPRSDAIIVLGAAQYNGRPSEVFEARLDHAAALYKDGVAPRVVTTGGKQIGDAYTEAQAGRIYLVTHGVPRTAIVEVAEGNDTLVELRSTAVTFRQHGWKTAVVVTDPWHSLRSRTMARDQGIKASTSPVHSGPSVRGRGTEARYIARETGAYLFYRLFHRASPPGASPNAT